jgi:Trk K+ transport system NAD-binding subunit
MGVSQPSEPAGESVSPHAPEQRIPKSRTSTEQLVPVANGRQFIICGDTSLAYRLAEELVTRYRADVTVILPDPSSGRGLRFARMNRVHIVQAAEPDADAFRAAGLTTADAVALVSRDDVVNVYAALQAQEICPGVRVVLRIFNPTLGQRLPELFEDAQVLSDVEIAAPAFVAAALGVVDPTVVRIGNRVARATSRADATANTILCGLADTRGGDGPILLPDDEASATLVLALDGEVPEAPPASPHVPRHELRRLLHNIRRGLWGATSGPLVSRGLLWIIAFLAAVVVSGFALFWLVGPGVTPWQSVYLMLFTSVGAGNAELKYSAAAQIVQTIVTFAGVAMLPIVSAAIVQASVHARLALPPGALVAPERGHVVVVGLGTLGTSVLRALHDRGHEVVAIDHVDNPHGAQLVREKRIHFIVGDASRGGTLHRANVGSASALVVVTTDDVTNLEYALQGRALRDDLRVVLRLFDGDFADRVRRTFDITLSRSVSYLGAPAFAAAMVGREVIGTIPVRRRVLLVADVPVVDGSWLVGRPVTDVYEAGEVRAIAMVDGEDGVTVWTPAWTRDLAVGDRLIVVATRLGLSRIVGQSAGPVHSI